MQSSRTQEKRFMLNAVSVDLKPKVVIDKDIVSIEWPITMKHLCYFRT